MIWPSNETRINEIVTFGSFASFAISRIRPHACARVFIEVQTSCACNFDGIAINAVIEDIANAWIWMSEEAIFTRAFLVDTLWCLQFGTIFAVNVERLIAFVLQANCFVEHQTIGAQELGSDTIEARIVFVALRGMFVLAAFVTGTLEILRI